MDDKVHDLLISDTTIKLGEIHWALLKSASLMDSKRWEMKEGLIGSKREPTTFGKEVGLDEIHWWIFKKETDVEELLARTERTLESVQTLKDEAANLRSKEPASYKELLLSLKNFAEQHRSEIAFLHDYVSWLNSRDLMAPRILFTYRVWGSTRRSERTVKVENQENANSDIKKLRELTEVVLGVRNRGGLVYDRVHIQVGFDIFESLDPEQLAMNVEIVVPESRVVRRTAYDVYGNCSTYFTEVRDSLRNILLDIEKFKEQRDLFQSDDFWREFIAKATKVTTTEPQLWDFKETLTIWHVSNNQARRDAKIKFAEDVASFANTTGGVLIVGVNDNREIVGVGSGRELETRLKVAADVIAQHVEYDNEIVAFRQITVRDKDNEKICLVIVVSQACNAVAVGDGLGHYSYPVRRESGVSRVSPDDLPVRRLRLKSVNRDFMHELRQFVRES